MNDFKPGYKKSKNPTLPWSIPGSNYPDLSSGSIIRSTSNQYWCTLHVYKPVSWVCTHSHYMSTFTSCPTLRFVQHNYLNTNPFIENFLPTHRTKQYLLNHCDNCLAKNWIMSGPKLRNIILNWVLNQGRIYVANEYPTFERTMLMVGQKLTFPRQITLNVRQNLSVLIKNMQMSG